MYKVPVITLLAVALLAPSVGFAKTTAIKCQYEDRSGVHTGVLTPAGGDGALCVGKKGKAYPLYTKPVKHTKPTLKLLDGRVVPR